MAQISIITHKDILEARRIDAEYFKPIFLEIEKKFKNNITLNDISKYIICGPFGSTILDETYTESGVEVIRPFNIKDCKIEDENIVYISEADVKAKNLKLFYEGDLFFARVGDIRAGILTHKISTISPNIIGVRLDKDKSNPYFLAIFFNTKYGYLQLLRGQKIVAQPTISTDSVHNLKIPKIDNNFQKAIEYIVKNAFKKQSNSKQLYKDAEQILLKELNLLNYTPKKALTFETTSNEVESAARFDAEYFQPKYEEIIKRIENYSGGFDFIENVLNFNNKNYFPKENQYYYYIPLSKVSKSGEIEIPEKELGANLPTRARRLVKKGEIVLSSISGSLETSAIIETEHENFIASNGFYVFSSKLLNSETLLILFKSKIMIELLQRISKGAILGGYDLTAFKQVKIPLIRKHIQQEIADKIQESHKLRKESKELLEKAKRLVEEEIEKQ